ncbi:MAG: endonuclease [Bacteroidales bacterium]|nr:endonuclease [Bacteroidales bacterium]
MKKTLLTILLVALLVITKAQIPAGYYTNAIGKTGAPLKTALYDIIKNHTSISYTALWTAYTTSDKKTDGKVWDMYSNCAFTFVTNQCGNYSVECDCYNREHSFPQSWFNEASPMVSDMFHVYPTDGKVNGYRSNYPFGVVTKPTYTSSNGSKLGPCTFPGYTSTVFEPIDEYKGDFARTYFYMATRYENLIASWQSNGNANEILNGTSFPCFDAWFLNLLFTWNASDPVSQKEIDRNNVVYNSYQHNRNPYIDHPEYANLVWGMSTSITEAPAYKVLQVYPNPVSEMCTVSLPADLNQQNTVFTVYSSTGIPVFAPVTVSGDKAVLNLENVPSGFYLVRLANDNYSTIYQARIIKK